MTDVTRAEPVADTRTRRATRPASIGGSLALVIVFWWLATGLTIAMQRADAIGAASRATMLVLALVGAVLAVRTRTERSATAARVAFLGAALLWWWSAALFYSGWGFVIPTTMAGASGSAALAAQAVRATLLPDAVSLAILVALGIVAWGQRNRVALATYAVFWGTLQTAKLNVFFGVRNPGTELLPTNLAALARFFGPAENSVLLPITLALMIVVTAMVARRGARSSDPHVRHGSAMLAVLLALAVLEHALLGLRLTTPLWDMFVDMRNG